MTQHTVSSAYPTKQEIAARAAEFPAGTRIRLVRMDDLQAPPPGTKGTVTGIDDIGSLMISWDNGSHLNAVYGEDVIEKM